MFETQLQNKRRRNKEYYRRHRDECIARSKAYYRHNRERLIKLSSAWLKIRRELFPELIKQQRLKSYYKNRDKKVLWFQEHYRKQRIEFLTALGGCICAHCGFSDWRGLQVDHIKGDGAIDRLKNNFSNSTKQRKRILENRGSFQVLCANCNQIKKYENKEARKKGEAPDLLKLEALSRQNL